MTVINTDLIPEELEAKKDKLWKDAKEYQLSRLDDAGVSEMRRKADLGGTKALAICNWVDAHWLEYYNRYSALEAGQDVSFDFSSSGELPYRFYDAWAEEI